MEAVGHGSGNEVFRSGVGERDRARVCAWHLCRLPAQRARHGGRASHRSRRPSTSATVAPAARRSARRGFSSASAFPASCAHQHCRPSGACFPRSDCCDAREGLPWGRVPREWNELAGSHNRSVDAAAENASMAKKYRDVTKALHRAGWRRQRTRGSHEVWRHTDGREVTVPAGGKSNREVPTGTLGAIRRATGLEELR